MAIISRVRPAMPRGSCAQARGRDWGSASNRPKGPALGAPPHGRRPVARRLPRRVPRALAQLLARKAGRILGIRAGIEVSMFPITHGSPGGLEIGKK